MRVRHRFAVVATAMMVAGATIASDMPATAQTEPLRQTRRGSDLMDLDRGAVASLDQRLLADFDRDERSGGSSPGSLGR